MSGSLTPLPALESVLCTEELTRRPARPPGYEKENRALVSLAQSLADSPGTILQTLADTILEVFQADSTGISLLTEDEKRFYWPAIAGVWKPHIGGGTPRDFGPCGDVLDRNIPLLFSHLERRYTNFQPVTPHVEECLLVPFHVEGKAVGTIWAIAHDDRRKFDSEDLRMLLSLGTFASAIFQAQQQLCTVREQDVLRQEVQQAMREMNEALLVSSIRQHELAEQAKQAEQKLHNSEFHYRRLFESCKDGILILEAHTGRIIDANAYIGELLGYSHGDFLDKELWEIGLFSDKLASEVAVRELQAQSYVRYEHLPLKSRRGQQVEVEIVANVYWEGDQSVIQCNIRDITDRSRLEKQMHVQTVALADLHRRKDEFLAMLSHELRNPLAPIANALHILRLQKNEDYPQRQSRIIIERQLAQLTRLVDDLMEVSRITTGRVQLRHDLVEMSGIVERAIETARPLLDQRRHLLTVTPSSQPIWLHADASRLEQVVVNLLTNAAKYTDEGGHVWLTIEQEGEECVLRVRDTGVGIAPELLPRVFDLFTQAERSLDHSQGGLGIGLALVQRLVEMHQGRVEAFSVLGQGSEFVVRLPVVPTPIVELPAANLLETSELQGPSLRVLVVDDNVDAAQSIAMLLRLLQHQVRTAHDGPTALEAALDFRPDIALLDIGLPRMDGFEVARRLRQQPVFQSLVLVAMTGYGQDSDRESSRQAGFDHHLVKPTDFALLQDILTSVVKKVNS